MLKLPLELLPGLNVTAASSALTLPVAPLAVQTPVAALKLDVTAPDVPVESAPAAGLDSVRVAVTVALSMSVATISVRLCGVSSV
jgi:hypothetical protein